MEFVRPKVYHVAATRGMIDGSDLQEYLEEVHAAEWETDTPSDGEYLIEVAGRLCYRSFAPGLNANVSKIREGSRPYLHNILTSKHGSVLEHATDTYIFHNVSRVFTHELVRHRPGCSYSQESLRYVRLDSLKCYYPAAFENIEDAETQARVKQRWIEHFVASERLQRELAAELDLDHQTFEQKKRLTSALRRLAPIGLATSIMMTANHRMWRHMIEQRTSRHAEEEIRCVFHQVYREQAECYSNIYQDAVVVEVGDGTTEIVFENSKV